MTDFRGVELQVGDEVVFTTMTHSQLWEGFVEKVNKRATVLCFGLDGRAYTKIVRSEAICKLN